ncbi:hypothetical protein GCM10009087_19170 [Sphingomonas oligophenolica]|uniref:Uncharacterized protein n=1 Tax=Sphingomonas oligophenolica TaxID=301154 RepID=A0ABU9Y335_9SPHN
MGNIIPFGRDEDIVCRGNPAVVKAVRLMKEALATLDRGGAGCTAFACHLSLAIDVAEQAPLPKDEEECQAMLDALLASEPGSGLIAKM